MKRLGFGFFLLCLLTCLDVEAATYRLALIVGNNEGSDTKPFLRFAEQDAKNLYRTLSQIGGFSKDQIRLLLGKNPGTVLEAVRDLQTQASHLKRNAQDQILFLFYFSGHSEGNLMEMGPSQLDYLQLREEIRKIPTTIRILILDTCQSGHMIQTKGGTKIAALSIPADLPQIPRGEITITSSTAFEDSIESSELQSSLFTHYFVSGLRGAADFNLDGKVSLSEVYSYANQHTLDKSTAVKRVQHPTYNFDLEGTGEVFITELMNGPPLLFLSPPEEGTFLIYDGPNLVADVSKSTGTPLYMALPVGDILVRKRRPDYLLEREIGAVPGGLYYFREEDGRRVRLGSARRISVDDGPRTGKPATLPEGELIRLRLSETITTKNSHAGDKIRLTAGEDIYVNGRLVVQAGASANGEILALRHKRGIVHGELVCRLGYVQAVDGQWIPLNSLISRSAAGLRIIDESAPDSQELSSVGSQMETDVASGFTALFFLPFYPVFRGRDAVLQEGTLFDAYVARNVLIH